MNAQSTHPIQPSNNPKTDRPKSPRPRPSVASLFAGIGMRFLNSVCKLWFDGENRYNKPMRTLFHTSHPNLAQALRRDQKWTQISAKLHGDNKLRCIQSLAKGRKRSGGAAGYGGHFRAVQGFRYLGDDFE